MTENPGQAEEFDPELLELWAKVFGFARSGATAEIAAYVDAGVSANLTNDRGDTLVMLAAYHGHADTVAALIERGADPNRENDRGQSPLMRRGVQERARGREGAPEGRRGRDGGGAVGDRRGQDVRQHRTAGAAGELRRFSLGSRSGTLNPYTAPHG